MTITATSNNRRLNCAIRWLLVGIVGFTIVGVNLYNNMIEVRRAVAERTKSIELLKSENTKLKNNYYTLLDTRTLTKAAERLGYVRDSNPSYLNFLADGSARQDSATVSLRP